jgi:hypothetical protein
MAHRDVFLYSPKHHYTIPRDCPFYLDTSVLRRRATTLRGTLLAKQSYTSALAIVELLARARRSDRDYRPVRAALTAIFDTELMIDWRMPDAQLRGAFPQSRPHVDIYDTRAESLRVIAGAVVKTATRAQFLHVASRLTVPQTIGFFEKYNSEVGEAYLAALNSARRQSKMLFDPQSDMATAVAQVFRLPPELTHDDYIGALRGSKINEAMSRWTIAEFAREAENASPDEQREYFMSYDGSIDSYLKALAWSHFDVVLGRTPGRNDVLDLLHLTYLVDGAHLVTGDRALAKLASAVGISVVGPESPLVGGA